MILRKHRISMIKINVTTASLVLHGSQMAQN